MKNKTFFLIVILFIINLFLSCDGDNGGVTPTPPEEDWSFPTDPNKFAVTIYSGDESTPLTSVSIDEEFDIKVIFYNLTEVFGAAIELSYPSDKIEIIDGNDGILISPNYFNEDDIVTPVRMVDSDFNRISCGICNRSGQSPISGSSVVFKIKCKATSLGSASFAINESNTEIIQSNGDLIPGFASLDFEPETISIQ